jgi:hypothetical protein
LRGSTFQNPLPLRDDADVGRRADLVGRLQVRGREKRAVGYEFEIALHEVGLPDVCQIHAAHRIEVRRPQKILIRRNDHRLGPGQEHHPDRQRRADPEPLFVGLAQRIGHHHISLGVQCDAVAFGDGVDQHHPEPRRQVELAEDVIHLPAVAGNQHSAIGRQSAHRLEDKPGRHAEGVDKRGAVQPFQQIDLPVEGADEGQRRVQDQPLADQRVIDRRYLPGGVQEDPRRADRSRREHDHLGRDRHRGADRNAELARIDDRVSIFGPRLVHGHRDACSAQLGFGSNRTSMTEASGMMLSGFSALSAAG